MTGSHDHAYAGPAEIGRVFAWAVALSTGFVTIQAGFGFVTGSLALLADAAHKVTDVAW